MAGEFVHTSTGTDLDQNEYESLTGHRCGGQTQGDGLGFDGTYWVRVAAASNNAKLYGVTYDGVSNDAASLQAALDVY